MPMLISWRQYIRLCGLLAAKRQQALELIYAAKGIGIGNRCAMMVRDEVMI